MTPKFTRSGILVFGIAEPIDFLSQDFPDPKGLFCLC